MCGTDLTIIPIIMIGSILGNHTFSTQGSFRKGTPRHAHDPNDDDEDKDGEDSTFKDKLYSLAIIINKNQKKMNRMKSDRERVIRLHAKMHWNGKNAGWYSGQSVCRMPICTVLGDQIKDYQWPTGPINSRGSPDVCTLNRKQEFEFINCEISPVGFHSLDNATLLPQMWHARRCNGGYVW